MTTPPDPAPWDDVSDLEATHSLAAEQSAGPDPGPDAGSDLESTVQLPPVGPDGAPAGPGQRGHDGGDPDDRTPGDLAWGLVLDSLIITNRLHKPLLTLLTERDCAPAGGFVFAPHMDVALAQDRLPHRAQHPVRGDSIDYVMCHDITTREGWRAWIVSEACYQHPHLEASRMQTSISNNLWDDINPVYHHNQCELQSRLHTDHRDWTSTAEVRLLNRL